MEDWQNENMKRVKDIGELATQVSRVAGMHEGSIEIFKSAIQQMKELSSKVGDSQVILEKIEGVKAQVAQVDKEVSAVRHDFLGIQTTLQTVNTVQTMATQNGKDIAAEKERTNALTGRMDTVERRFNRMDGAALGVKIVVVVTWTFLLATCSAGVWLYTHLGR